MRVGLMVPGYIDMFYPQVGKSTLGLLEKLGVQVDYPIDQTCCGQLRRADGLAAEGKTGEEIAAELVCQRRRCTHRGSGISCIRIAGYKRAHPVQRASVRSQLCK
jgi:hypothetical protein